MTVPTLASPDSAIAHSVRQFIVENFFVSDPASLPNEASLITGGVVDSTGMLEVITFLETAFGIRIADQEMVPDNLETIDRIASFVARKRQAAA
jgi:acyl carrier protein